MVQLAQGPTDAYSVSINFTVVTTAASAPRPVRWGKRCFANRCDSVGFHGSLPWLNRWTTDAGFDTQKAFIPSGSGSISSHRTIPADFRWVDAA